jgi:exodeoxyribonuclease VII large subunit
VDTARTRLGRGIDALVRRVAHRLELATAALRSASPRARLARDRHRHERLEARLRVELAHALDRGRHRLGVAAGQLDSLSPLAVLARGYSLTRTPDGAIVRTARQVRPGEDVEVLLHEGRLDCRVIATRDTDEQA